MIKNINIPAVHDKDLRAILGRFGVIDNIEKGEIRCSNCNEIITWDNLFAFKITEKGLLFFCDEPDCIEKSSN